MSRWDGFSDDELVQLMVALIERALHIERGDVVPNDIPAALRDEVEKEWNARLSAEDERQQ